MKEDLKRVKVAFVAFSVLVLLTPRLCGQNPDELLVVRLPAKHGRINQPGAAPIPFATVRDEIAASAGLEGAEAWRLAVAHWGAVTAVPVRQQAKVNLVVIVPAGRTKRGQDFPPSQNFRQFSLWATRLDDCRHQAREIQAVLRNWSTVCKA